MSPIPKRGFTVLCTFKEKKKVELINIMLAESQQSLSRISRSAEENRRGSREPAENSSKYMQILCQQSSILLYQPTPLFFFKLVA